MVFCAVFVAAPSILCPILYTVWSSPLFVWVERGSPELVLTHQHTLIVLDFLFEVMLFPIHAHPLRETFREENHSAAILSADQKVNDGL